MEWTIILRLKLKSCHLKHLLSTFINSSILLGEKKGNEFLIGFYFFVNEINE